MLAGGVGITPFLSVLRHFAQTGAKNRVCLFWANKTFRDAFAAQELSELAGKLNLRVMHVLSRQKELPESRPENSSLVLGRIRAELIKDCLVSPTTSFYICGPAPMQEQMLKELASLGVDPARIQKELFGYRPKA